MFSALYGKPSCAAFKTTSCGVSTAIRSTKLAGRSSPRAETQGLNHPQPPSLLLFPFFGALALQSNRNVACSASVGAETFPGITASLGPFSLSYYLPHCCCFGNRSFQNQADLKSVCILSAWDLSYFTCPQTAAPDSLPSSW